MICGLYLINAISTRLVTGFLMSSNPCLQLRLPARHAPLQMRHHTSQQSVSHSFRRHRGYAPERQHPGGGRTGGPVLEMHQGGRAGTLAGPENYGMGIPDPYHAHYGRQGTVVGAGTAAAQGFAGG